MQNPLLLQARAAIAGEGLKAKKVCRLTKWLLSTQNKLRTIINRSSIIDDKKPCSPMKSSSKSTQQRRIHNEIFGWTSDAWDEMSACSSHSTTPTPSPAHTTPSTGFMSREEALIRAEENTLRRFEKNGDRPCYF